jgi:hypothetical protein
MDSNDDVWGSWEAKRKRQYLLALDATPEQRLAWLEEMIRLAHASGALPRTRSPASSPTNT